MATTHNLGLTLPTVGADSDTWGDELNADLSAIDALWANIGNVVFGTAATKNTGTSGATVPLLNGTNTWAAQQIFSAAPTFSDQPGARTALGLGSAAVQNTGTSGAGVPLLSGTNTWAGGQTFSGGLTGNVTGNVSGTSGSCTGNAASASTAARLDLASGVAIDWDGTNIRFIIGGVVKAYVNPTTGLTNNV